MNWKVTFSDSNNKSDKIPGRSWMQNKRGSSKLLFVIGRSTTAPGEARQTTNVSTAAPSLSWLSWRWCNGVLCFISLFVHPRQRAGASWPPAFWEKPYSEMRIPTCFMLSLHISLHSRCLLHVFVCVCACVFRSSTLAESGQTGGATRHTERNRWSESANNESVCEREREKERDTQRVNEITFPKTLRSRWLSLRVSRPGTGRPMSDFRTVASFCYTRTATFQPLPLLPRKKFLLETRSNSDTNVF